MGRCNQSSGMTAAQDAEGNAMRGTSALVTATALVLLTGCQGSGGGTAAAPTTTAAPPLPPNLYLQVGRGWEWSGCASRDSNPEPAD